MSEEEIIDPAEEAIYERVRARLEKEMGKQAWGGASGGGSGASAYGSKLSPQAEVEAIYQAIREEKLTPFQEKRLRELRLGPMFSRLADDIVGSAAK